MTLAPPRAALCCGRLASVGPAMATFNDSAAEDSFHIDCSSNVIPRKWFKGSVSRRARGEDRSGGARSSTEHEAKQPQSRQCNAPIKLVRCSLLPTCDYPKTDLATPIDGVNPNVAWRLWKRQARMKKKLKIGQDASAKGPERVLVRFPWNDACRKAARGEAVNKSTVPEKSRARCDVCKHENSRDCRCGVKLAATINLRALTSFVEFVRASTTPVYRETEPRDQKDFLEQLQDLLKPCANDDAAMLLLARYSSLAACSGRPAALREFLPSIRGDQGAATLPNFAREFTKRDTFWRGGQAHGSLRKDAVHEAIDTFLKISEAPLAAALCAWAVAKNHGERRQALVCVLAETRKAAAIFKSRDYFTKRCLEIILLGSNARGMNMQSSHLDAIISQWPVSNGTKRGALRIFPAARDSQHIQEGLRVLQRALGGGQRKVPLVCISAFLCCYLKR